MNMQHINRFAVAGLAAVSSFAPSSAFAQRDDEGPSVTIYSSADPAGFDPQQFIAQQRLGYNPNFVWQVPGFGVVKEVRALALKPGTNELKFTDVAAFIDPTTVSFADLTDPDGTSVLEQNFRFDLVSADKLYEKYVDRDVEFIVAKDGREFTVKGTVLSVTNGMFIVRTGEGIQFVPQNSDQLKLPPLPLDGLVTKPTLLWLVRSEQGGEHQVRTTYQTAGLTWRADYNLVLNGDDTEADLGAWVSLMNLSGASYRNAKLKLVAGDVQRIEPQQAWNAPRGRMLEMAAGDAGFEEKAFFEYHLYTLPRRTDILENSTQQIMLFPTARGATVKKVLVMQAQTQGVWRGPQPMMDQGYGASGDTKVDVYIRFRNEERNQLGIPLPAGKVRVYKEDEADGTLEFIGEDLIDHTPKNEEVLIKVGQAFDVVGERTQTNFSVDSRGRTMSESFTIKVRNRKEQPVTVIVRETLSRGRNWEIVQNSQPFTKVDAFTIEYALEIPPDGERTVTYAVKYTW